MSSDTAADAAEGQAPRQQGPQFNVNAEAVLDRALAHPMLSPHIQLIISNMGMEQMAAENAALKEQLKKKRPATVTPPRPGQKPTRARPKAPAAPAAPTE